MRFACLCFVLLLACGDDDGAADAAVDAAAEDGGRDVGPPDSGPVCAMTCGATESCCVVDGTPTCVDIRENDENCGACGVQCGFELGLGESCARQRCACGNVEIGCRGDRANWCCPPREGGLRAYCADLDQDYQDCGDCGAECDSAQADRCEGGRCRCGLSRDACTGERDSTCCVGLFDVGCVDLGTNRDHCGECENRCGLGETCADGTCVRPGADAGADAGSDAGSDAGVDAGVDASADAGADGAG